MRLNFFPTHSALRHLPAAAVACSLLVLALAIGLAQQRLRTQLRGQLAARDAQILFALWEGHLTGRSADGADWNINRPADQLEAILQASQFPRLHGLLGTRLFDLQGGLVAAVPAHLAEEHPPESDWQTVRALKPLARYALLERRSDLFLITPAGPRRDPTPTPILKVMIPLTGTSGKRLVGAAQFVLDGHALAAEYARLDEHLWLQGLVIFLVSGSFLLILLGASFHCLKRTTAELAERTARLVQADRQANRTLGASAIGAVAAQLIGALEGQVSALETLALRCRRFATDWQANPWQEVSQTVSRMKAAVTDTSRVLSEIDAQETYTMALSDFLRLIPGKVEDVVSKYRAEFRTAIQEDALIFNKQANLLAVVLSNLVRSLIETAGSRVVFLKATTNHSGARFEITDQSSADGVVARGCAAGNGAGAAGEKFNLRLAINQELLKHLGGTLQSGQITSRLVLSVPWQKHGLEPMEKPALASLALAC